MKVELQEQYWRDILGALSAMQVMTEYCLEEKEDFCKDLHKRLTICKVEIIRMLLKKEKAPNIT